MKHKSKGSSKGRGKSLRQRSMAMKLSGHHGIAGVKYGSTRWFNPLRRRKVVYRTRHLNRKRSKRFIQAAIKRPGALTATLRRWRILSGKKKAGELTAGQLDRAYARAKKMSRSKQRATRQMGTRTMRQINLYRRVLKPASKRKSMKATRRRAGFRVSRRKAANPYGYIIAGRTRPHAWSQTEGYPYKDRSEAKRALAERVRAMGRRGDDVAFDAYLTEPKGRKIRKTRIRVPGYAPNPDVRLHWTAQYGHKYDPRQRRSVPDLRQSAAWWRTGLKKPKDVREAVKKAHKYALKQKDWVKHRVTVEGNPGRKRRNPIYHYKHRYDSKQPWQRSEVFAEDYDFATQLMMKRHPDMQIDLEGIQDIDSRSYARLGLSPTWEGLGPYRKHHRKVLRPSRKTLLRPRARN